MAKTILPVVLLISLFGILISTATDEWRYCPKDIESALVPMKEMMGTGPLTMKQDPCNSLIITNLIQGVKAHKDCATKSAGKPDCNFQRISLQLNDLKFKCIIERIAEFLKLIAPTMNLNIQGGINLEGEWKELIIEVTLLIDLDSGTCTVTNSTLISQPGALKVKFGGGNMVMQMMLGALSKNPQTAMKIGDMAQGVLKAMLPNITAGMGETLSQFSCEEQ